MYTADEKDCIVELSELPQSSVGAPCPLLLADEYRAVIAFYLQDVPSDWDGTTVRIVSRETEGEPIALVLFTPCYAKMFGPPNDEAFSGHPLASRGLQPYSAVVVENSSWVRQLEQMNAIHRHHRPEAFKSRKHFILSFHDSTFECVAGGFTVEIHEGAINDLLPRMMELLN